MIIETIDKKIHHLKQLDFIERTVFSFLNPEDFYRQFRVFLLSNPEIDLGKEFLTVPEIQAIDDFVRDYYFGKIPVAQSYFVRAYIVGRFLALSDLDRTVFEIPEVVNLPGDVIESAEKYNLLKDEVYALTKARESAGMNLTNTTRETQKKVNKAVQEAIINREGIRGLEERLRNAVTDDIGELNRDWKRVAINETNKAFSNGYISQLPDKSYIIGISMPDACPECMEKIHNRIYEVIKDIPVSDFSHLSGDEYKQAAAIWEKKIWEGKNNHNRSSAKRKRIDPEAGNRKDNLVNRAQHELNQPVIPLHISCRCRWMNFNPELQWLDENGEIRFSFEDRDKYKEWFEKFTEDQRI